MTETQPTATSRPTFNQTRPPASLTNTRFKRDPNRHYLLVEHDRGDYESLIDFYLSEMLDKSGDTPYIDHGYIPGECKSKRQSLLSCSKAYYEWVLQINHKRAMAELSSSTEIKGGSFDRAEQSLTRERPRTIGELGGTEIQDRDAKTNYPIK